MAKSEGGGCQSSGDKAVALLPRAGIVVRGGKAQQFVTLDEGSAGAKNVAHA